VLKGKLDLVLQDLRVQQVQLEPLVLMALLVLQGPQVLMEQLGQLAPLELLVLMVPTVQTV
jgi:hypothetical protein